MGPDVFAEHQHPRIGLELLVEHAADRGDHVDALAAPARLVGRRRRLIATVPQAADLLQLALVEDVVGDLVGRRDAARLGLGARGLDLPCSLALKVGPLFLADLVACDMGLQLRQRIARPFRLDFGSSAL